MHTFTITGKLVDLFARRTYPARLSVEAGVIRAIEEIETADEQYILPGFIDAHIHIESSMLLPTAFANVAVLHGTVATVSDPHEIANVCGAEGVQYMIDNSKKTPFKFFFGAPSCVPATSFETAGATLDAAAIAQLLASDDIWYLSEMMNYPGVLNKDPEVMAKIEAAHKAGKPVDGHAPGLRGEQAAAYASHGITTDHECVTLEEALDKIKAGMHILIREGSAAKNYDALCELLRLHPEKAMFCSDDKHPDELVVSHINALIKRSLEKGYDLYDVLCAASMNPVQHYKLPVGLLRVNDPADFIVVDNLKELKVLQTYIDGNLVCENGETLLPYVAASPINNFKANPRSEEDFVVSAKRKASMMRVIKAIEGQLVTQQLILPSKVVDGKLVSDVAGDVLKLSVVNRYEPAAPVATAFIKGFGLKRGAIASTVGHDCHNIIVVGVDDASMCAAVNALIDNEGGISVAENRDNVSAMPLPVAGLMSLADAWSVAEDYKDIDSRAKKLGTNLHAPFMTLSFMALLVIPSLKLSDKGLFDGSTFKFTPVQM